MFFLCKNAQKCFFFQSFKTIVNSSSTTGYAKDNSKLPSQTIGLYLSQPTKKTKLSLTHR